MPGELVILAVRTSMGKTALSLQIASDVAARGKSVLFASLEMTDKELIGAFSAVPLGLTPAAYVPADTVQTTLTVWNNKPTRSTITRSVCGHRRELPPVGFARWPNAPKTRPDSTY